MKRLQGGFTLIELAVVIVVIGILAAITTVTFQGVQDRARSTATLASVDQWIETIELRFAKATPPREGTALRISCLGSSAAVFPATDGFALGSCVDFASGDTGWDNIVDGAIQWYSNDFYNYGSWWTAKEGVFDTKMPITTLKHNNGMVVSMRGVVAYAVPHGYSGGGTGAASAIGNNTGDPYVRIYWIVSSASVSCGKGHEDTAWMPGILTMFSKNAPVTSGKVCQYTMTY